MDIFTSMPAAVMHQVLALLSAKEQACFSITCKTAQKQVSRDVMLAYCGEEITKRRLRGAWPVSPAQASAFFARMRPAMQQLKSLNLVGLPQQATILQQLGHDLASLRFMALGHGAYDLSGADAPTAAQDWEDSLRRLPSAASFTDLALYSSAAQRPVLLDTIPPNVINIDLLDAHPNADQDHRLTTITNDPTHPINLHVPFSWLRTSRTGPGAALLSYKRGSGDLPHYGCDIVWTQSQYAGHTGQSLHPAPTVVIQNQARQPVLSGPDSRCPVTFMWDQTPPAHQGTLPHLPVVGAFEGIATLPNLRLDTEGIWRLSACVRLSDGPRILGVTLRLRPPAHPV